VVLGTGLEVTEHIAPTGIRSPDRPARCYPQYKHSDSRAVPYFKKNQVGIASLANNIAFLLDFLTPEGGTDRLCRTSVLQWHCTAVALYGGGTVGQ